MAVSHTGTYWQSHLQGLCTQKGLAKPHYEVFEHSGSSVPMNPDPSSGVSTTHLSQSRESWYSCVVSVGNRDFETNFVYKAEENAKEKAAARAYKELVKHDA